MDEPSSLSCLRCIYHGRVQGVGFRATTASIAVRYAVEGYVRNRSDGTVELLVVGLLTDINEFRGELHRRMGGKIVRIDEETVAPPHDCTGFQIRYS